MGGCTERRVDVLYQRVDVLEQRVDTFLVIVSKIRHGDPMLRQLFGGTTFIKVTSPKIENEGKKCFNIDVTEKNEVHSIICRGGREGQL